MLRQQLSGEVVFFDLDVKIDNLQLSLCLQRHSPSLNTLGFLI